MKIAQDNYEKDSKDIDFLDTFGYVKMSKAARVKPMNRNEIIEAKALFKEALEHAERMDESRNRDSYLKEIINHYVQAQKVLGEYVGDPPVAWSRE